jgi:hypothetical protein
VVSITGDLADDEYPPISAGGSPEFDQAPLSVARGRREPSEKSFNLVLSFFKKYENVLILFNS